MADQAKRRSGSFSSQETAEASNESAKKLSLSEGSIVDKETSPQSNESSPSGTLKKPRKFKPRKYLAKKLKLRKSDKEKDDQEANNAESQSEQESIKTSSSVSSKLSEKLSSPKLQRFNFVKRFSSGKKSYRVSPSDDGGEDSKDKLRSLSVSESSVHEEIEPQNFISQVDIPLIPSQTEPVTLESKKVELKITMAKYEKLETSQSAIERSPVEKASFELSRGIELPQASREQFFARSLNVEQLAKPINEEDTFAAVVRDGLLVKPKETENSSEVEKYSILTSSLQTILSTARDLEEFGARGGRDEKDFKFPEYAELKILEESDEKVDKNIEKPENLTKVQPESVAEVLGKIEEQSSEKKVFVKEVIEKTSTSFNTSTPLKSYIEQDSQDFDESIIEESEAMKKQKQSKIPIDQKRLSASFDALTTTTTVHTQEAKTPYHVNLSPSSSEESPKLAPEQIKFEVGTPVKNFPSPTGSTAVLAPLLIQDTLNSHESSDEVFHSPKSEQSLQSESITRRKIEFVPQLTIYTPEEQELLKSNFAANADSFDLSLTQPDSSVFPIFDNSEVTMTTSPEKREHLYKILVIGELGTGKTSFIKRYVHQFFSQNYRATIGVDFALKVLNWDQSTIIRLQLWDIAGQERFGNMTRVYYKEAVGAFIVFDVTRSATFDAVIKWKQDLDAKVQLPDGSPIPTILLANKCDQQKQGLVAMPAKMDEYCAKNGFAGWFETSAKDNVNIEESAKALVSKILVNDKLINNDTIDGDRIVIDAENPEKKSFCSC